jgi:hypothetical protein
LDAYFESVDAAGPCAANETVCADVVRAQLQPFLQLIVFSLTQNPHEELHATVVDCNGAMCVSHFAIIAAAGARKGVSTPPATCPPPRGGRVNDCSWIKRIDIRVRNDRDARVATQLQPNHESLEFWPLRPCSL